MKMFRYYLVICFMISIFLTLLVINKDFIPWHMRQRKIMERWNFTMTTFNENMENWNASEEAILKRTHNCSTYFDVIPAMDGNIDVKLFESVKMHDIETSLAFSIMAHSQPGILELFLALYFRPDNHFVIHIDKKANKKTRLIFSNMIYCYQKRVELGSIILLPKDESVTIEWGTSSILQANLIAYRRLLEINQESENKWSHVITNAGSELPILSYSSFRLLIYNRLNTTESALITKPIPVENWHRVSVEMKKSCIKDSCQSPRGKNGLSPPWIFQLPNPMKPKTNYTFQIFKGTHINTVLSSVDVDFIANTTISKAYYLWVEKMTISAEEHHMATLLRLNFDSKNNITQDINGKPATYHHGICPKYVVWSDMDISKSGCKGRFIRQVCNFGVGDLDRIQSSACLFANKFNLDVDKKATLKHFSYVMNLTLQECYDAKNRPYVVDEYNARCNDECV